MQIFFREHNFVGKATGPNWTNKYFFHFGDQPFCAKRNWSKISSCPQIKFLS